MLVKSSESRILARAPLEQLKGEAVALANQLGSLSTQTRAASAGQIGSAKRRRAGTGEDFWEYRRYKHEDGAQRIDWRRSAKGTRLYVRETELETARTYLFWVDPSEGFAFNSKDNLPEKADRALVLSMALAGALSRAGERCGVLGGGRSAVSGARAISRVGEDMRELPADSVFPRPPREHASAIICSDFYAPIEEWRARLQPLAAKCREGLLVQVCDPLEVAFPFEGRTRFARPGESQNRIVGKAESIREGYLERFAERREAMTALAAGLGWRFMSHETTEEARIALNRMAHAFQIAGVAA